MFKSKWKSTKRANSNEWTAGASHKPIEGVVCKKFVANSRPPFFWYMVPLLLPDSGYIVYIYSIYVCIYVTARVFAATLLSYGQGWKMQYRDFPCGYMSCIRSTNINKSCNTTWNMRTQCREFKKFNVTWVSKKEHIYK